jgi:hypothetical protein
MQAFREAADGIRTHDLLHGKQLQGWGGSTRSACISPRSPATPSAPAFQQLHRITAGLDTEWTPSAVVGRRTTYSQHRPEALVAGQFIPSDEGRAKEER